MVDVDDYFNNLDGLSRLMRVRYDTPTFFGGTTSLSTSYSDGGAYDVRVQHSAGYDVLGGIKVAAAGGYFNGHDTDADPAGVSGSLSVLHTPSGISLTGAGGAITDAEGGDSEPSFAYGKLGWQGTIFDFGKTAVSADAFMGWDYENTGSESDSYGFQLVQNVSQTSTEVFLQARVFEVEDTAVVADFDNIYTVFSGVRQRF